MKKAARYIIKGTVQGIFFRQFIKEHADKLNLKGFVRNLTNGDIEIRVEGIIESIERFTSQVKKGPEHCQIRDIQIEEKKWEGEFKEFKILRF
ncbi:acylphosphatase [archaeon]|jgi:acylphosphatase|nr:acylphosphatase [archaeon]MBT6606820.1 acylphosphatase [archaeon]MBT7251707.1 acylphosphatase [archaeon]MBT7660600.1 acylphosphatase [archaeon]